MQSTKNSKILKPVVIGGFHFLNFIIC